ncbi:MAG: hypothetical protein A2163_07950 [Actinobacteria bacterium RBG_13_35_12]|nr:MAG: hypothetical protein A2163_07950 [Actinobacteria bacterium RBG_13_35_12]
MDLIQEIKDRRQAAEDYLSTKRLSWDTAEKLFHNQLNDSISEGTKSQVFDPKLSTLAIERGYRVMSQLATGKVRAISKNDLGASKLMNLIIDKYVVPNANAQFDLLTKLRMMDMYSNVYGNFFALIDWAVKPNGYVGPDVWLLNIRDVFPQVGAVSLEDSDYVIVRTWKPLSYFENLRKEDGFKNIDKILAQLRGKGGDKQDKDSQSTSKREEEQYPQAAAAKDKGYFEVLTQFERDRWVDYCSEANMEFRDMPNPHEDNDLPVKCKYAIPLLDDFMGMSDFERGAPMQMVVNSVWNLYLDAVKMSIYPPVMINKDNVAAESSFKWGPAEKWLGRGAVDNIARTIQLTPKGIETFNNTYQIANAALLNLFGTTDTATTAETSPEFGKTPKALQMQQMRENTRDNSDRFFMEQFVKDLMRKFANLVSKKQKSAITMRLFADDIEELRRSYPDIDNMYDEKTGKVTIGTKSTGSILYDYEIVSGSTFAQDQKTQQENISQLIQLYLGSQTPQGNLLVQQLQQEGYKLKFGELMKKLISNSGIQDWDKILEEMTPQEIADSILQTHEQQFMQAMQGGQNIAEVLPQPQEQPPPEQPIPQGGAFG